MLQKVNITATCSLPIRLVRFLKVKDALWYFHESLRPEAEIKTRLIETDNYFGVREDDRDMIRTASFDSIAHEDDGDPTRTPTRIPTLASALCFLQDHPSIDKKQVVDNIFLEYTRSEHHKGKIARGIDFSRVFCDKADLQVFEDWADVYGLATSVFSKAAPAPYMVSETWKSCDCFFAYAVSGFLCGRQKSNRIIYVIATLLDLFKTRRKEPNFVAAATHDLICCLMLFVVVGFVKTKKESKRQKAGFSAHQYLAPPVRSSLSFFARSLLVVHLPPHRILGRRRRRRRFPGSNPAADGTVVRDSR